MKAIELKAKEKQGMGVSNLNPQFLVDESGNKSLVVLTVKAV